ncbi:MAG: NADP-dependent malic enzyme [Bacteroidales bacterium]|nr:NADP-dependent malic enzyme [Bacteroidales bacterium]MBN2817766.1 NADP-dependent malic enzyme [Bacteroidales bacterium]
MAKITKEEALRYHSDGRAGKIEVIPTKPYSTQYDLSLAYTPGVAEPCLEIEKNPKDAYRYTAKNNLVAVMSNGTAVLGLGNIGALAGKPVMEGKGLLFKVFADVDVFDIEIDKTGIEEFIDVAKAIAPTFGGINLEDIKAPECFEIEERLKAELDIPVFHDDQHGTAIISGAGLINALEIIGKDISKIKVVVNGAGASGISCTKLYLNLGVKRENIYMLDSKGLITTRRKDLNKYKQLFAQDSDLVTLKDVIKGADVFLGLSKGNILSQDMVRSMAKDPIVFAMANPTPEISYEDAMAARPDIIMATGRSDYPNQINNVLGFPFIFRGALDVKATNINEEMKMAASKALAQLAKQHVPEKVNAAYKTKNLEFGREYIIPKPLDPRLITEVAPAVAKAAMDSGVARETIDDWDKYKIELLKRMGLYNKLINDVHIKAKHYPKRILFSDAEHYKVLKAVQIVRDEKIAEPILLGRKQAIRETAEKNHLNIEGLTIIDFCCDMELARRERFAAQFFEIRKRKGITYEEAFEKMSDPTYFGMMMVEYGEADGFLTGFSTKYANTLRPALQIIGSNNSLGHIAGMYIVQTKRGPIFFADTTVNIQPSGRTIADTTILTANEVRKFNIDPVVALISYSNFGTIRDGSPQRVREAIEILHRDYPDLLVDGEMQANYAFDKELRKAKYPFTKIGDHDVNTIIFPNLSSGNIAYKMMHELADCEVIGPILLGIRKPVHILQMESSVRQIVDMAAITAVDAQENKEEII